jgi:hypothetical protein
MFVDKIVKYKVCQWLTTGQWFSPDSPVSSTNKTDPKDITEILLKVALNTINQPSHQIVKHCNNYRVKQLLYN